MSLHPSKSIFSMFLVFQTTTRASNSFIGAGEISIIGYEAFSESLSKISHHNLITPWLTVLVGW